MQQRTLEIAQLLKFGVEKFRQYGSFIIGIMVTYYVLAIVPQIYYLIYDTAVNGFADQVISFLFSMLQMLLSLGLAKITLLLIDDRETEVTDLINNLDIFLSYFVATIIYMAAVLVGVILLVIPGIIVGVRLQFYPYYIIEEKDNAFVALQKSFEDTKELTLELVLFGLAVFALNLLGFLFFGVGIIFTYPVTQLATAVIYKGLIVDADRIPTDSYLPDPEQGWF